MKKLFLIVLVVLFASPFYLFSANKNSYPELLVVPKASERLELQARLEREDILRGYSIYLASTSVTMLSGVLSHLNSDSRNPDNRKVNYLTIGVGAAFTGVAGYLALSSTPYLNAAIMVKKLPAGNEKYQLIKERIAEERIDEIARFNKRLRYFTGFAQIGLGIALMATSRVELDESDKEIKNNNSIYAGGANIAAALFNMFICHPSETISKKQKEYKKKIFTYILPSVYKDGAGLIAGIGF
jgi:hypothetical protein